MKLPLPRKCIDLRAGVALMTAKNGGPMHLK